MAPFDRELESLKNLSGKVIVITGGCEEIAFSVLRLLQEHGAHIVFGVRKKKDRTEFIKKVKLVSAQIDFVETDVARYQEVVGLFKRAFEIYGRIDHAIACSNISGEAKFLANDITIETIDVQPDVEPLEINLIGSVYFSRVALVFLKHDNPNMEDRSLTLLSSANIFSGTSHSPICQISMIGLLQLMRSLRPMTTSTAKVPIRINVVCPTLTISRAMDPSLIQIWKKEGIVLNLPEDIASVVCCISAQREISSISGSMRQLHGCAITCCGSEAWEFEEALGTSTENCMGDQAWESFSLTRKLFQRLNIPIWGSLER